MLGASPAVMVACGGRHTLVLTADGRVWDCGDGGFGRLGHGDSSDLLVMTNVRMERFEGALIVMVAAGALHSVAVGAEGIVWSWGCGFNGRLGHSNEEHRFVPTQLLALECVTMVAAKIAHTVVVTDCGELLSWGRGIHGQLGLGDANGRLSPTSVKAFEGSQVRMAACGDYRSLFVTEEGDLWTCGLGAHGTLGLNNRKNMLVPARVDAQHFDHARIVSFAAGITQSVAVTESGDLYTWGSTAATEYGAPVGGQILGHNDGEDKLVPTRIALHLLQGARVGRCFRLPSLRALAFAMGTHARLGSAARAQAVTGATNNENDCAYVTMPGELVKQLVEACESWPEGQASEMEGVIRLLGGRRMRSER